MNDKTLTKFVAASRRGFVKGTATVAAAGALAGNLLRSAGARAASTPDVLRVGLVGCGGRGTGAAAQALAADKNVKLVALGDAFSDRIESCFASLQRNEAIAPRIDVPKERRFVGFDAYKGVIDSGVDVVLLATPPHFRPIHLQAAIDAGKHVFAEKPVAVDAAGVRKVLAACEQAKKKNLSVMSGLCWRYDLRHQDVIKRIHGGAIGEVRAMFANDFRGTVWFKPRKPGMTDMQYQMHNWYNFNWLSGDFNVEQHVHVLDACAWALKGRYPVKAYGTGGRAARQGVDSGNIFDHHAVTYEYENGLKVISTCRQYAGSYNNSTVSVIGTKGEATLITHDLSVTTGKKTYIVPEDKNDKYQLEHDFLFNAIRKGKLITDGEIVARGTLMGIMGRMATYTGQAITWDQALNAEETWAPAAYDWNAAPPETVIAIPGRGKA